MEAGPRVRRPRGRPERARARGVHDPRPRDRPPAAVHRGAGREVGEEPAPLRPAAPRGHPRRGAGPAARARRHRGPGHCAATGVPGPAGWCSRTRRATSSASCGRRPSRRAEPATDATPAVGGAGGPRRWRRRYFRPCVSSGRWRWRWPRWPASGTSPRRRSWPGRPSTPGAHRSTSRLRRPSRWSEPSQPVEPLGVPRVDPGWLATVSRRTGIPAPGAACLRPGAARRAAGCEVGWTTLAGIGWVESQHGTIGGRAFGVRAALSSRSSARPSTATASSPRSRRPRAPGLPRRSDLGARGRSDAVPSRVVADLGRRRRRGRQPPTRTTSTTRRRPPPATSVPAAATSPPGVGGRRRSCPTTTPRSTSTPSAPRPWSTPTAASDTRSTAPSVARIGGRRTIP